MSSEGSASPHIVFRVDSSLDIGTGHVMRCLTLADELAGQGASCRFICRDLPGHLGDLVRSHSHMVDLLNAPTGGRHARPNRDAASAHDTWLGASWQDDAKEVIALIAGTPVAWLVVDHYGIGAPWEQALSTWSDNILVIDDLCDRRHWCDLLLDQTAGRSASEYQGLVPPHARVLAGSGFALLRRQFAQWRGRSRARRQTAPARSILVSMGGTDPGGVSAKVLDELAGSKLPAGSSITVVVGPTAPTLRNLQGRAASMPVPTSVLSGVEVMAALMAQADLAIGAPGTTSWERCCVGLPSILITIADNQRTNAQRLKELGAAEALELASLGSLGPLVERLLRDREWRLDLSAGAARICDGLGATRVLESLAVPRFILRPASPDDAERVWIWREAGESWRYFRSVRRTSLEEHLAWFEQAVLDPSRRLYVIERDGVPCAHVRFDLDRDLPGQAEVSIVADGAARGQGVGRKSLAMACRKAVLDGLTRLRAHVHARNLASVRLFEGAGFRSVDAAGPHREYMKDIVLCDA